MAPCAGKLAGSETAERLKEEAREACVVVLLPRQLSDLDLPLSGGFPRYAVFWAAPTTNPCSRPCGSNRARSGRHP